MTRVEILNCLTDRPCVVCKFHESGRCERWNCVFEEKPDDCGDTDNYENEIADLQNRLDIAEYDKERWKEKVTVLEEKLKSLSAEPCEDAISRQVVLSMQYRIDDSATLSTRDVVNVDDIEDLPPVTPIQKMGHCKDCKWWKDSDGAYRRGIEAESICPINNMRVIEGNGYCYMFEPKMQEVEE